MNRQGDPGARPQGDWDPDLEAFVQLVHASFTLLQPPPDFEGDLRARLVRTAADLYGQPQRPPVPRLLLVGAAAALSLVGAGAGAAWWMWKTRPRQQGFAAFLPARGS